MSEMTRNPRVMKKAQEEVKQISSRNENIDGLRLHKLNNLQVVIKGTLILDPAVPLLCSENFEIN